MRAPLYAVDFILSECRDQCTRSQLTDMTSSSRSFPFMEVRFGVPFAYSNCSCCSGVDCFSRKIMWLRVVRSNNNPKTPLYLYARMLQKQRRRPLKVNHLDLLGSF